MVTAKLFQNGKSQAVRLTKGFRLSGELVYVKRVGNTVVLLPYNAPWHSLVASLSLFSDDFLSNRKQPPIQKRGKAFA